jgi:pimeloyl-ACP methyl ester carboxylesterase
LRDGRTIGVVEVGSRDGVPILHCHGSGSSRLEVLALATSAATLGVRLIGLDRPGVGCSDPKTHFRLLEWPDDVAEVADQLGLARFAIEGMSLGGAFALACAYKIPARLTACGLVSTVPPPQYIRAAGSFRLRLLWRLGAWSPRLLRWYARRDFRLSGGADVAAIERWLIRYISRLGAADQKLLADSETRRQLAHVFAEGGRQGWEGYVAGAEAGIRPWGFRVEDITLANLCVWHGEQDSIMPVAPVRRLTRAVPHCTATFYPNEAHYSTLANHVHEIWHALCV